MAFLLSHGLMLAVASAGMLANRADASTMQLTGLTGGDIVAVYEQSILKALLCLEEAVLFPLLYLSSNVGKRWDSEHQCHEIHERESW